MREGRSKIFLIFHLFNFQNKQTKKLNILVFCVLKKIKFLYLIALKNFWRCDKKK